MTGVSIDFLPVGSGSKSGDCILIEYGSDYQKQVMVVDGGSLTAGSAAVEHINTYFGAPAVIEHVVCTHQDGDHSSGLRKIIEAFEVRNLWIHQPWLYAEQLVSAFKYRWTADGLRKHLRDDCFPIVASLCDLAEEYGVPLREPFQGTVIGPFHVLAPNIERYLGLVPQMGQTPAARELAMESIFASVFKSIKDAVLSKVEGWGIETLETPAAGATSITNETSVVLLGQFDSGRVLLTGDAGIGALQDAIYGAAIYGLPLLSPDLVQIPHHGSRRNVSPGVLDAVLGEKQSEYDMKRGSAISSVSTGAEGFPRKVVENAFTRRGYACASTKDGWKNWTTGLTPRGGLSPVSPAPMHGLVED